MAPPASSGSVETTTLSQSHAPVIRNWRDLARLSLGGLGVVYGDIGTSPLYAIRECFLPAHGIAPTVENVLGILSLVFWALVLVIVVKYASFVLKADNEGNGGVLALLALITEQRSHPTEGAPGRKRHLVLVALGLIGASLLLGEGMITPAISVLGALEGLDVATDFFRPFVMPIAAGILVALFTIQRRGTAGIGVLFGPVMLTWFAALSILGGLSVAQHPEVLGAVYPGHAVRFFAANGIRGFLILGSVVLCVTGGEALFADLGHFGRRPIRFAWYSLVFPALLLNYFGQGALLIAFAGTHVENPFFLLAPEWLLIPLVVLATLAAVIASQAMISGAFSLAQQAVQLGYFPRLTIVHTSEDARGQIYVPEINNLLMVACLVLVVSFGQSSRLAAAYGISVMGTMICTSILLATVTRRRWGWPIAGTIALGALFLGVEIPFFAANFPKIAHGGWIPIAVGSVFFVIMTTWRRGRQAIRARMDQDSYPLEGFLTEVEKRKPHRVDGTAVFMTSALGGTPPVLLHHFKHNKILHRQVVILTVVTEGVPQVAKRERVQMYDRGQGFWEVVAHYGFMQTPNVPEILRRCEPYGLAIQPGQVSYYLGRETILVTGKSGLARWRKRLFILLSRNARPATDFFRLPPNRVVELGSQIEI
jgi:KUP system potassium uptake protein